MSTDRNYDPESGEAREIPLSFFLRGPPSPPAPIPPDQAAAQAVLGHFPDPLWVAGAHGEMLFRNPAAAGFMEKWTLTDLPPALLSLTQEVIRTGKIHLPKSLSDGFRIQRDEIQGYYLPRVVPLPAPGSEPARALLILQDATGLRSQDELKTHLVTMASHEIKSPLTSLRTAIYLLVEETFGPLNAKQRDVLQDARRDIEQVLALVNQLLDLESLESGTEPLAVQPVNIVDLIEAAKREVRDLLRVKDLRLIVEFGPDLPALSVDSPRICLALRNLFSNAIKFSPRGGEIILRVGLQPDGQVRFSLQDQGPGIPEIHLTRVFERFYRIPGQQKAGTGLGLAIARQNVLAHRGTIGCRSESGRGSEFYFTLPAAGPGAVSPATACSTPGAPP